VTVPAVAERRIDELEVFIERASTRAYLWSIGEYESLPEAVDQLQYDAERDGLIERIGQDCVQLIMSNAFEQYRNWQEPNDGEENGTAKHQGAVP
jgi:hypothetical protein